MATKRYSGIISALGTAIDYQNLILVLSPGASGEGSNVNLLYLELGKGNPGQLGWPGINRTRSRNCNSATILINDEILTSMRHTSVCMTPGSELLVENCWGSYFVVFWVIDGRCF